MTTQTSAEIRARDEAAEAERQAEQRAANEERRRIAAEAERERVKALLRSTFIGTSEEFEREWPALWREYRNAEAVRRAQAERGRLLDF